MGEDISRNIVVVMLVVAVLISLLGTWTVMSTINSITVTNSGEGLVTGRIAVEVLPDPAHPMNQIPAAGAKNSEGETQ